MNPCHYYCKNVEIKNKYRIASNLEDLTEEEQHQASECKFCEVFMVLPETDASRYRFCPCCATRTHRAMRQQGKKGKWFEV